MRLLFYCTCPNVYFLTPYSFFVSSACPLPHIRAARSLPPPLTSTAAATTYHQSIEVRQRIAAEEQRTLFKPQLVPALPSVAAQFSAAFHAHFTPNGGSVSGSGSGSARKMTRADGSHEDGGGGEYAADGGGEGDEQSHQSQQQQPQPAFQRPPGANVFHRLYSSFVERQQREQAEAAELALSQQQQQQQQLQSSAFRPSGSALSSGYALSTASPRGSGSGSGSGNGGAYSQAIHGTHGTHGHALYQDAIERRQRMEAVTRRRCVSVVCVFER